MRRPQATGLPHFAHSGANFGLTTLAIRFGYEQRQRIRYDFERGRSAPGIFAVDLHVRIAGKFHAGCQTNATAADLLRCPGQA